jgi:hypothetical protein
MEWPRDRWLDAFSHHRSRLAALPDALDRPTIRQACADAAVSPGKAEMAFLVAMAWGYGRRGYGPWRTARILSRNRLAANRLHAVASTLRRSGAEAAYWRLADERDCRLRFLGPAFGTKFLAFCSTDEQHPALILDRLVAQWLRRNTNFDINATRWNYLGYCQCLPIPPHHVSLGRCATGQT